MFTLLSRVNSEIDKAEMAARQQSSERSHVPHMEGRHIAIRVLAAAGLARGAGAGESAPRYVHVFNVRLIGQGSFGAIYQGVVTDAGDLPLLARGANVAVKFEMPCVTAGRSSSLPDEFDAYSVRSPLATRHSLVAC